ncbi:MAG: ABC transporter substrate-binding protein [Dehalococcoidia bacterium]|nr:ABC transporter substrate-binding protein [Dehalococcoidia bacterium]
MTTASSLKNLRLMETFRNLFYTPIYVAVSGGFFYRHGLNVMFSTMPEGGAAMDIIRSGEVDVVQTGVSRSFVELDLGHEDAPLHIAEINRRDGFFLVSREPTDDWEWKMLEGTTLAPVGFTPVPWNSLRAAMLKHGVDLDSLDLVTGLSAQDALDQFRAGAIDYVHMPHPQAGLLVAEGSGHIATALGPELGHICYSSFAAMPDFIESHPDTVQAFVNGFDDALRWLAGAEDAEVVEQVEPFFAELDSSLLQDCIHQYRANNTWPESAAITESSYNGMRDILIDGGMVRGRHEYDRLVRPEFAATSAERSFL